ncbi:MAG: glycosyltransferase family 2 protein [Syntrophaceae bacterium]|nr:glycosyltransferase family 2 protein [Syntrophaceae bacterium]
MGLVFIDWVKMKAIAQSKLLRITGSFRYVGNFAGEIGEKKVLVSRLLKRESILSLLRKMLRVFWREGLNGLKTRVQSLLQLVKLAHRLKIDYSFSAPSSFAEIKTFSISILMAKLVFCKERVFAAVMITNTGEQTWEHKISLSYHLYKTNGELLEWDGLRTPVETPISPGATKNIVAQVEAPEQPGEYLLEWDLVFEEIWWLSDIGKTPIISHIEVVETPIIENMQPIIINSAVSEKLKVVIAVRTWNLIRTNRLGLFRQTINSLKLAGYPNELIIFDNGSSDGTADLIRDLGAYTLPPDEGIANAGRGMNMAIEKALLLKPDIIVFSDDDILWHDGFLRAIVKFWSCAPSDIAIMSGFVEPRFAWNTVYGIVEYNGIRALLTSSAPGGSWTFRAKDWKNIAPLPENMIHDSWGCAVLRARGRKICQADLALHIGDNNSAWGNMAYANAPQADLDSWGGRYCQI